MTAGGSQHPLGGELTIAHPLALAMMEVALERGYREASLAEIATRAGVGITDLERTFANKDALALRVMEVGSAEVRERVGRAFAEGGEWPGALRAAAWELARWIGENPAAIRFGMVGVLDAGEMTLVRREELFRWFAGLVDAGRAVAPHFDEVPEAAPTMVVGAIVELLRREVDGSSIESIPRLVAPMMYLAVLPYLGEEAAAEELTTTPPLDFRDRV